MKIELMNLTFQSYGTCESLLKNSTVALVVRISELANLMMPIANIYTKTGFRPRAASVTSYIFCSK